MTSPTKFLANGQSRYFGAISSAGDKCPGIGIPAASLAQGQSAFTLVEVVLALGLFSFALLSLMSLLPVGLDSSRQALQISRIASVFQKVTSDLTEAQFANVAAMVPTTYYFDYDGNTTNASGRYITVIATVATSPITNQSSTNLVRVKLESQTLRETNAGSTTITICDMGY